MIHTAMIHVPRTAGTAMKQVAKACVSYQEFEGRVNRRQLPPPFNQTAEFTVVGHRSPQTLIDCGLMNQSWWENVFRFAFVRNTWDRLVSSFRWYCKVRLRRDLRSNVYLSSFETFVTEATNPDSQYIQPIGLNLTIPNFDHVRPQTDWVRVVNFTGRFENLQHDWKSLCAMVEMPYKPLPKKNSTRKKSPYQSYYTLRLRDMVADHYREEIERFGFVFGA